ncbi:MAG: hypothetical protein DMF69_21625 [Acidobacteria bacterium]|nr:MAG: hypothetical protein DMF69_21625 [Acidobacteriota bacterium]
MEIAERTGEEPIDGIVERSGVPAKVEPAEVNYDADAEQRFKFQTERSGRMYTVVHVFGPILDEQVLEYERARNQRLGEAEYSEADDDDATAITSTGFNAAINFWNKSGASAEGYAGKVSDRDKAFAVGLLFGTEFESLHLASEEDLCPETGDDQSTLVMRCLFDGQEVYTNAVLKTATPNQIEQFENLQSRTLLVKGTKFGQRDQRIPAKAKRLAEMFDQMVVSTDGYAGRVPLHHKAAFALRHLRSEQKAITGN